MTWRVVLARTAEKQLRRLPPREFKLVPQAIDAMRIDPLGGDVVKLEGLKNIWRRRVGNYRIIFELVPEKRIVFIYEIARRTTTTY